MPCVLFSTCGHCGGVGGCIGGKGQLPGKFVTKPLTKFDDLTGKAGSLSSHHKHVYHKENVIAMENFRKTFVEGETDIRGQLNESYKKDVEQNRDHLCPVVDTVLTYGT